MQVSRGKETTSGSISLLKLKEVASRVLPISSATRRLILSEKDVFPASEALAKFEVFDRLLCSELAS